MSISPVLPGPLNLHRALCLESKEGTPLPDGTVPMLWRVRCMCGIRRCWYSDVTTAELAHDAHALQHGRKGK